MTAIKLLVTGGAGFIGSAFINHVFQSHPDWPVVNLDKLTYAAAPENIQPPQEVFYRFVQGDIGDRELVGSILRREKITHIINFAAETHVDRSITASDEFFRTNVSGLKNLLDCARFHSELRLFYQISTDEVYGDLPLDSPHSFQESSPLNPRNPYSASKAAGDLLARSYWHTYGLPIIISRCGNNYGPNQYPEKLIPFFIKKLSNGEKAPVYGDGLHVRDWIHTQDHAAAIEALIARGRSGEIYNIGGGNEISNLALAKLILAEMGLNESCLEFVLDRPGHDRRYSMNPAKIKTEIGWQPQIDFQSGLRATIQHYLHHFSRQ